MSKYYDTVKIQSLVESNRHRNVVGGMWNEIGQLQFDALRALGLNAEHTVLDIGCGSLRLGRKLVPFLKPQNYFGTDLNESLLEAGYAKELDTTMRERLPRHHLRQLDVTSSKPFDRTFDFLVAFSLFTHLTYAQSQAGLAMIAECMHIDSCLLATFFLIQGDPDVPKQHEAGVVTYVDKDPFHLDDRMVMELASNVGLDLIKLNQHKHPRGQTLFALQKR